MKEVFFVTNGNGSAVAVYCTPETFEAATKSCTAPDCKACLVGACATRAVI